MAKKKSPTHPQFNVRMDKRLRDLVTEWCELTGYPPQRAVAVALTWLLGADPSDMLQANRTYQLWAKAGYPREWVPVLSEHDEEQVERERTGSRPLKHRSR